MKKLFYQIKNFLKNLYNYRKILWTDQQFDFGYLLELEKFKLQLMLDEFRKTYYVDTNIRWIEICIKLIDIIQEEDSAIEYNDISGTLKCELIKHVNINNASRFQLKNVSFTDKYQIFRKDDLRQRKALYLYNKIRYNYIYEWWD